MLRLSCLGKQLPCLIAALLYRCQPTLLQRFGGTVPLFTFLAFLFIYHHSGTLLINVDYDPKVATFSPNAPFLANVPLSYLS